MWYKPLFLGSGKPFLSLCPKSALGKYEADDFKDISPFSMVALAKFYGVSTDYLLGLIEQKNHPTQSWTLCIWVMMQSKY